MLLAMLFTGPPTLHVTVMRSFWRSAVKLDWVDAGTPKASINSLDWRNVLRPLSRPTYRRHLIFGSLAKPRLLPDLQLAEAVAAGML